MHTAPSAIIRHKVGDFSTWQDNPTDRVPCSHMPVRFYRLAQRTTSATEDVNQIVGAMQDGSSLATDAMGEMTETIATLANRYQFKRATLPPIQMTNRDLRPSKTLQQRCPTALSDIGSTKSSTGSWRHSKKNLEAEGTNSYTSMPGDTATIRFNGERLRLFGLAEPNHGKIAVSIDGGSETIVDQYDPHRAYMLFYDSPDLPQGDHVVRMRATGEHNPKSSDIWVSLEHVEVESK